MTFSKKKFQPTALQRRYRAFKQAEISATVSHISKDDDQERRVTYSHEESNEKSNRVRMASIRLRALQMSSPEWIPGLTVQRMTAHRKELKRTQENAIEEGWEAFLMPKGFNYKGMH